jgi:site-specific DNA recombinase
MADVTILKATNPYKKSKLRVAAYCRVSTSSDDQKESLTYQRLHYEKYIKSNPDWEYVDVYSDEGISGTKKDNRIALMRLIADCENKKVDIIVTKSISRFSRSTTDCLELVRKLSDLGVYVVFEKESIDTRAMDGELMLSILSGLAENESRSMAQNIKWSIRKSFEKGTYKQGYAPYGYNVKDGVLTVEPEQAKVVKRIFQEALSGKGSRRIANGLNEDGIKPKKGLSWHPSTIQSMLKNERYIGDVLLQKTFTDDNFRKYHNYGEEVQYYRRDQHEAIISREDFEMLAEVLKQRRKNNNIDKESSKYNNRYIFTSRIKCYECGGTYKRKVYSKYIAWCCTNHIKDKDTCSNLYIREEEIKIAFATMMNKLYAGRNIVIKPLIKSLKHINKGDTYEQVMELEKLIDENTERGNVLSTFVAKKYIDLALFNKQMNEVRAEAKHLKDKKQTLINSVTKEQTSLRSAEKLIKYLNRLESCMDDFDEGSFDEFVETVEVISPTEIGFKLKCGIVLRERVNR